VPITGYKQVDLPDLYRQVGLHGGYEKVTDRKWWRNIGKDLCVVTLCAVVSSQHSANFASHVEIMLVFKVLVYCLTSPSRETLADAFRWGKAAEAFGTLKHFHSQHLTWAAAPRRDPARKLLSTFSCSTTVLNWLLLCAGILLGHATNAKLRPVFDRFLRTFADRWHSLNISLSIIITCTSGGR
jgi:hypothetical protein